jgi:hypothetical protein
MLAETLEEGAARAIAGEPGEPQDESTASYATAFTAAELVLDLENQVKDDGDDGAVGERTPAT